MISVLIACATAPINMLVDFLFLDIIAAPSADEFKVELESRQMRQRLGQRVDNVRGSLRSTVARIKKSFKPTNVLPSPRGESDIGASGGHGQTPPAKLSSTVLELFALPDTKTRKIPPSLVQSYASTSMILKDVFASTTHVRPKENFSVDERYQADDILSPITTEHSLQEGSMYDSAERGGAPVEESNSDASLFASFCALLFTQCERLDGYTKAEFQDRWGLDVQYSALDPQSSMFGRGESDFDSTDDVSVPAFGGRMICCAKRAPKQSRKCLLSSAITKVAQDSREKVRKLKTATDVQIGLEIMHLFIIDLLG